MVIKVWVGSRGKGRKRRYFLKWREDAVDEHGEPVIGPDGKIRRRLRQEACKTGDRVKALALARKKYDELNGLAVKQEPKAAQRVTLDELMTVGERRLNMLRAFNAREGIGRDADKLTRRLHMTLEEGPSAGRQVTAEEVEHGKDMYYQMAGWDGKTGYPKPETLTRLGLDWVDLS